MAMRRLSSAVAYALCVAALLERGHGAGTVGHGYTPQDIENGGLLYQANCTACHGPEGDGVPASISAAASSAAARPTTRS